MQRAPAVPATADTQEQLKRIQLLSSDIHNIWTAVTTTGDESPVRPGRILHQRGAPLEFRELCVEMVLRQTARSSLIKIKQISLLKIKRIPPIIPVIASAIRRMIMKMVRLVGLAGSLLCLAGATQAQSLFPNPSSTSLSAKVTIAHVVETPHERHMRQLWIASIVAMTAGTAADAVSSWHKRESNSLLASSDGTFGAKGVTIKAGIASAVLVPQIIFRRHHDWYLPFAASNFVEAGIFAGTTAHNVSVK